MTEQQPFELVHLDVRNKTSDDVFTQFFSQSGSKNRQKTFSLIPCTFFDQSILTSGKIP